MKAVNIYFLLSFLLLALAKSSYCQDLKKHTELIWNDDEELVFEATKLCSGGCVEPFPFSFFGGKPDLYVDLIWIGEIKYFEMRRLKTMTIEQNQVVQNWGTLVIDRQYLESRFFSVYSKEELWLTLWEDSDYSTKLGEILIPLENILKKRSALKEEADRKNFFYKMKLYQTRHVEESAVPAHVEFKIYFRKKSRDLK